LIRNASPVSSLLPTHWWDDEHYPMATLITGAELREAIAAQTFVKGGDPAGAEGVKYDFRMSNQILKAEFGAPIDAGKLGEAERGKLVVSPGEVVFVLTEETLEMPRDMIAQLSPKRKMAHAGIQTLGGFTVDPGYSGRLLLGLLNISSTPFQLIPGKKVIGATFFRLEGSEVGEFPEPPEGLETFPDELVQVMRSYQPIAVQSVSETVQRLQADVVALQREVRERETWYRQFQQSLEATEGQINRLSGELLKEQEVRKGGQDELTKAVTSIERTLSFLRGAAWILGLLLGSSLAIALGVTVAALTHTFGF
jgi:deoxycytidine triphosphate deaminase